MPRKPRADILWFYAILSPVIFASGVYYLGAISPGYNQLGHTISRLAIEQYGFWQKFNMLQFAAGLYVSGFLFARELKNRISRDIWQTAFRVSALLTVILIIFPTDPVDNKQFIPEMLTYNSIMHIGTLMAFFIVAPFGIHRMSGSLRSEGRLARYSRFTGVMGYSVVILCFVWIAFYVTGTLYGFRGIFQKGIALMCVYWLTRMLLAIRRT